MSIWEEQTEAMSSNITDFDSLIMLYYKGGWIIVVDLEQLFIFYWMGVWIAC